MNIGSDMSYYQRELDSLRHTNQELTEKLKQQTVANRQSAAEQIELFNLFDVRKPNEQEVIRSVQKLYQKTITLNAKIEELEEEYLAKARDQSNELEKKDQEIASSRERSEKLEKKMREYEENRQQLLIGLERGSEQFKKQCENEIERWESIANMTAFQAFSVIAVLEEKIANIKDLLEMQTFAADQYQETTRKAQKLSAELFLQNLEFQALLKSHEENEKLLELYKAQERKEVLAELNNDLLGNQIALLEKDLEEARGEGKGANAEILRLESELAESKSKGDVKRVNRELKDKLKTKDEELAELRAKLEAEQTKRRAKKRKFKEIREKGSSHVTPIAKKIAEDNKKLKTENKKLRTENKKFKSDLAKVTKDLGETEDVMVQTEKELKETKERLVETAKLHLKSDIRATKLQKELIMRTNALKGLESQLKNLQSEEQPNPSVSAQLERAQKKGIELIDKNASLKNEIAKLKSEIEDLKKRLESNGTLIILEDD